jgi:hypothetical protein
MMNEKAIIETIGKAIGARQVVRLTTMGSTVTIHPLLCGQDASGMVQIMAEQVAPLPQKGSRVFFIHSIERIEVLSETFSGGTLDDRFWRRPLKRIFSKVPAENPCWMFQYSA